MRSITCVVLLVTVALPVYAASISSEHFDLVAHGEVSTSGMASIVAELESQYGNVLTTVGIDSLPRSQVNLFENTATLIVAARNAGERLSEPSAFITLKRPRSINIIFDEADASRQRAVHQLVHLAAIERDPDSARQPRWLWESIALFGAKQFIPPHTLSCISLSYIPRLWELDVASNPAIHKLGYLLGEYITTQYGEDALARLLSGTPLTDLAGLSIEEFENRWHLSVVNRYLRNRIPPILSSGQIASEVAGHTFYLQDGRNLYFAGDRTIHLAMGDRHQSGRWYVRGGADVCWRRLNLPEFCVNFRLNENHYWLDTPSDCARYSLRREKGNPEAY
jgi:hypothetical protein